MKSIARRAVLRALGVVTFVPPWFSPAIAAERACRFVPPSHTMRYRRRLERSLSDGEAVIVTRDFAIRFLPNARGYLVTGEQLGVSVSAPEQLAQFARIEEERIETGLFPLRLDANGKITGKHGESNGQWLDDAVDEARAHLAAHPLPEADRQELNRFISAIHNRATLVISQLPGDLFAPEQNEWAMTRELPLSEGLSGTVSTSFSAQLDASNCIMQQAERLVVTEIAGQQRRASESWSLTPLD